jgi:hypothetical protein
MCVSVVEESILVYLCAVNTSMNTYVMKDVELYSSVVRVIIRYFRSKNLWSSFILVLAGVFSDAEQTTRLRCYDWLLPRFRINNELHVLGGPCTIHLMLFD